MRSSKFVRAGIVLSVIWVIGSVFVNWPSDKELRVYGGRVYERCMGLIDSVEGYQNIEDHLTEMQNQQATPGQMRDLLKSEGFRDSDLKFPDNLFAEKRGGGFFDEIPALQAARLNRVAECQARSYAQRNDAKQKQWIDAVMVTFAGLALVWLVLSTGRWVVRWVLRGA